MLNSVTLLNFEGGLLVVTPGNVGRKRQGERP